MAGDDAVPESIANAASDADEGGRERAPRDGVLRAAMDRLARRDWGRGELVDALTRAGFDPDEAETAVHTCVDRGWLDEATAARNRALRLRQRGPVAPARIADDLERRRIDPEVAARVAAEVASDPVADAEAAIRHEIERRGSADAPADALPWPLRRRLAARLARRGFDEETLCTAMRRCGVPIDEPPADPDAGGPVDLYD